MGRVKGVFPIREKTGLGAETDQSPSYRVDNH
jgi:hypothetical protein